MRIAPVVLLAACTSTQDTGAGDPLPPPCSDCDLVDDNNYAMATTLTADVVQLQAETDATIDWSALTVDVQGHPVQDGDISQVLLVAFAELPPDEVAEGLAKDQLTQSEAAFYLICEAEGRTSCQLSEFSILGSSFDVAEYFLPQVQSWLLIPSNAGAQGGRSFLFVQANDDVTDTTARIDNDTSTLAASTDLLSLTPLVVPEGEPDIALDWTGLETDGLGNPMDPRTLTSLWVARYDEPIDVLEERLFDLELMANEIWTLDLAGGTDATTADLQGDRPFPGFSSDQTWLLSLRCTVCTHPAPRFITQVVTAP